MALSTFPHRNEMGGGGRRTLPRWPRKSAWNASPSLYPPFALDAAPFGDRPTGRDLHGLVMPQVAGREGRSPGTPGKRVRWTKVDGTLPGRRARQQERSQRGGISVTIARDGAERREDSGVPRDNAERPGPDWRHGRHVALTAHAAINFEAARIPASHCRATTLRGTCGHARTVNARRGNGSRGSGRLR